MHEDLAKVLTELREQYEYMANCTPGNELATQSKHQAIGVIKALDAIAKRMDLQTRYQAKKAKDAPFPDKSKFEDTTKPAGLREYLTWLRGYVKEGGKVTHTYDYPFSRAKMRIAVSSPLLIDSDYEYGACARNIIVAEGVTVQRSDPRAHFNGYGHDTLYLMDGYRLEGRAVVPVFSDPEFKDVTA